MIPVFKPTIKRKEMDSVLTVMVSENIGPGPAAEELVKTAASCLNASGGAACASYTDALGFALAALELEEGSRVVVSALSPAAYLEELYRYRLEPVIVDVIEANGSMDMEAALEELENGAGAVIVHYPLGYIPDIERLVESGVPLIEDITTAYGGHNGNGLAGTAGNYTIMGLEPEHLLTAGGGALLFAAGRKESARLKQVVDNSSRSRLMSDMNAALAQVQFRESEHYFERRKELASFFGKAIMKTRHSTLIQPGECENVHFSLPVMMEGSVKDVGVYARKKGVETALAFADSLISISTTESDNEESSRYPNARRFMLRCLLFPLYPMLGKKQAEQIAKVLSTLP
jgi:perosamine synthetase